MEFAEFVATVRNMDIPFSINTKSIAMLEEVTSGSRGGNCWGRESVEFYDEDAHEKLNSKFDAGFDKIMMRFKPNISYLEYKSIVRNIVKSDTRSEREYYGNRSNYSQKYFDLKDLHALLFERN